MPRGRSFAVRLGDVGAAHRGWFVAFGAKAFLDCVQIVAYAARLRLDVVDTYAIDPRRSLVRPYSCGFRYEPFRHPFRYGASVAQAGLLSFHENMTEVRPLGSTGITPLHRYYGPLRIPTVGAWRVIDSPPALLLQRNPFALESTSGLPGSSVDLSTRALPNHPGQSHWFVRSFIPNVWQASPSLEGWPLSTERNEAESGSLALGSRLRRRGSCRTLGPPLRSKNRSYSPRLVTLP